jgi:uncharacterized lipoprotein YddW (UPF0748 family)
MMKQSVFNRLIVFLCIIFVFCTGVTPVDAICPDGDLDGDCWVTLSDLVIFSTQWLDGTGLDLEEGLEGYWKLDEDSGLYATDSSGNTYTGQLRNGPVWQPTGGMVAGALLFDGNEDYVDVPFVLNPADGPLSVFAWVNGGYAPELEVIITQKNDDVGGIGREWLQIESTGTLVTRLTDGTTKLACDVVITDGAWHHVGVVWDGSRRYLYVDGDEAARDEVPLSGLQSCTGAMYIGAGKTFNDSCWSGLIDDIRIYSRAVGPNEVAVMAQPAEPPSPDDANLDGRNGVNLADFAILAYNWMMGPREYRCIWVDTWQSFYNILDESQCDRLIQTCRDNNINTIMPEIRKVGDAYYESSFEPWATNISKNFDPLGYLCDIAHDTSGGKKYVEVHAWFVAQRISTSLNLPDGHVLLEHPEYVMTDNTGSTSTTLYLDPGHPGSVDYNVAVITDCLSNYDIDGINLDYIRYPGSTWGYNPVSVARFNAFYGKSGQPSLSDPDWSDWRRECMTLQVKKIYVKSLMIDPTVVVTPDTVAWGGTGSWLDFESSRAYYDVFQDWVGWLRAGIIDYNALMAYTTDEDFHEGWCHVSLDNDEKRGSILSTAAYKQPSVQDAMDQLLNIRSWGAEGLNIYDYGSEVLDNDYGETREDFYRELKAQVYPEWLDPPVHEWKVRPTTGIFEGNLTDESSPIDHGTVEIEGDISTRVYTDGSGWYAIMEVPPGTHLLRFSMPGHPNILVGADMPAAGQIVTVNADFAD